MVNQWGRDGNSGSGNASSRSAAGVVVPAIIALILGVGGGYAGARFMSGVSETDIVARDKRIAELNKTLSDIKFDSQSAPTQQTVLQQRVKDLQSQVDQLKQKNALRTNADRQDAKAKDDAAAEIAALKKRIEEAGNLSDELARTKKTMKASDLQIIELNKTVEDQKAEIGKLQAAQQQANDAGSPALVLAQAQKTMLEAQLEEAQKAAADIPELKSRVSALEDEVTKASDDSDQKAAQISALQKLKNELQAKLDAASKSSTGAADQQAQKIADLQKQLDEMAQSLAARDDDARKADDSLKGARAELEKSRNSIKTLTEQNATFAADRETLRKQVASLKDTVAALKAKTPPANDQAPSNTIDTGEENAGLTPRNSDDVHKAVADLPGFDGLAPDKQTLLIDMLVKGACVTDALKAAYGHVSPISLRSLFRNLGGSC